MFETTIIIINVVITYCYNNIILNSFKCFTFFSIQYLSYFSSVVTLFTISYSDLKDTKETIIIMTIIINSLSNKTKLATNFLFWKRMKTLLWEIIVCATCRVRCDLRSRRFSYSQLAWGALLNHLWVLEMTSRMRNLEIGRSRLIRTV